MSFKSSICVLVSGGLDSDVLLAEMGTRFHGVWPVYVRQGLAWELVELYWLRKFIKALPPFEKGGIQPLTVLSLPMADVYGRHWSTGNGSVPGSRSKDQAVYLPGRNLTLSLKAAVFGSKKGVSTLALGSLGGNPFPDATPGFLKAWSHALTLGLKHPLRVVAPYRTFSKADVIRRGRAWPLQLSFSCIAPRGRTHCGRCNKCAERRKAFRAAGVEDKTVYAN